jgi:hypothetical protein
MPQRPGRSPKSRPQDHYLAQPLGPPADEAVPLGMPPTRSGPWRPGWCWPSCARRWRCPGMPARPRWACSTSPTTMRRWRGHPGPPGAELPEVTDWAGTVGVGMAASNVEYFDEPALAVMLCDLPPTSTACSPASRRWARPEMAWALSRTPRWCMPTPTRPDLGELIAELAERTATGYLFGGLSSSRAQTCSLRWAATATSAGRALRQRCVQRRLERRGLWRRGGAGVARHAGLPAGVAVRKITAPTEPVSWGWTAPRWTCCCATWPSRWSSPSRPCCGSARRWSA